MSLKAVLIENDFVDLFETFSRAYYEDEHSCLNLPSLKLIETSVEARVMAIAFHQFSASVV